jgi:hypothetical protein
MLKRFLVISLLVLAFFLASPAPAYAYLDPGTGSYVFQILIAALVGVGFLVKIYWVRIKGLAVRLFSKKKDEGNAEN